MSASQVMTSTKQQLLKLVNFAHCSFAHQFKFVSLYESLLQSHFVIQFEKTGEFHVNCCQISLFPDHVFLDVVNRWYIHENAFIHSFAFLGL